MFPFFKPIPHPSAILPFPDHTMIAATKVNPAVAIAVIVPIFSARGATAPLFGFWVAVLAAGAGAAAPKMGMDRVSGKVMRYAHRVPPDADDDELLLGAGAAAPELAPPDVPLPPLGAAPAVPLVAVDPEPEPLVEAPAAGGLAVAAPPAPVPFPEAAPPLAPGAGAPVTAPPAALAPPAGAPVPAAGAPGTPEAPGAPVTPAAAPLGAGASALAPVPPADGADPFEPEAAGTEVPLVAGVSAAAIRINSRHSCGKGCAC